MSMYHKRVGSQTSFVFLIYSIINSSHPFCCCRCLLLFQPMQTGSPSKPAWNRGGTILGGKWWELWTDLNWCTFAVSKLMDFLLTALQETADFEWMMWFSTFREHILFALSGHVLFAKIGSMLAPQVLLMNRWIHWSAKSSEGTGLVKHRAIVRKQSMLSATKILSLCCYYYARLVTFEIRFVTIYF